MTRAILVLGISASFLAGAAPGWAQSAKRHARRPRPSWVIPDSGSFRRARCCRARAGRSRCSAPRWISARATPTCRSGPITGAYGLGRAEIFGSLRMITRIDRDASPLLFAGPDNEPGGLVNDYPTFHDSWSGNKLGDLFLGAKFNLTSQRSRRPLALAIRAMVKAPTADKDSGAGTGEYDGFFDVIAQPRVQGVGALRLQWGGDARRPRGDQHLRRDSLGPRHRLPGARPLPRHRGSVGRMDVRPRGRRAGGAARRTRWLAVAVDLEADGRGHHRGRPDVAGRQWRAVRRGPHLPGRPRARLRPVLRQRRRARPAVPPRVPPRRQGVCAAAARGRGRAAHPAARGRTAGPAGRGAGQSCALGTHPVRTVHGRARRHDRACAPRPAIPTATP